MKGQGGRRSVFSEHTDVSMGFKRKIKLWAGLILTAVGLGLLCGVGLVTYQVHYLPDVSELENYKPSLITRVTADDGTLLKEFFLERRIILERHEVPELFIKAVLAAEDADFYNHWGIDLPGIMRALWKDILAGAPEQGASTITQQLAKTLFLTPAKTISRKVKEAFLAIQIERRYTKDEILMLYINQIYFGHGNYGAESAARYYFGKKLRECGLEEFALIAALLKAPEIYSPLKHPERALNRRNLALKMMAEKGFISNDTAREALLKPVVTANRKRKEEPGKYFVEEVRKILQEKFGSDAIYKKGMTVHTTLDVEMQKAAESAAATGAEQYYERHPEMKGEETMQVALVAVDQKTGGIKAMVGGVDFEQSRFNRAVQAYRQVGSAFKPFIFLTALKRGMSPSTIIVDAPVLYKNPYTKRSWEPRNYHSSDYAGPVTLLEALDRSINIAAIKLLDKLGIDSVIETARALGIESNIQPFLSLALGTSEFSLLEMTRAYSTVAAKGLRTKPFYIKKVIDNDGRVIYKNEIETAAAIDEKSAFQLIAMLESVIQRGTGIRAARLNHPLAGKTGTTDDYTDAWFMGFSPSLTCGVWVGFDQKKSLGSGESGSRAALPVWMDFMSAVIARHPEEKFIAPPGLARVEICRDTGQIAVDNCPVKANVYYKIDNLPSKICPVHSNRQFERIKDENETTSALVEN